jgi:putative redox protein
VTHHRDGLQAKDRFVREIELVGPLNDAQRARLLDISMRCPVHLTMERGSIVETRLTEAPLQGVPTTLCEHARDAGEACEQ